MIPRTLPGSLLEVPQSAPHPCLYPGSWLRESGTSLENTATDCTGNCRGWGGESKRERGPLWETIKTLPGISEESVCRGEDSPTRIIKEQREREQTVAGKSLPILRSRLWGEQLCQQL